MTDAIEFGPEIKRGSPLWPEGQERPEWLADGVHIKFCQSRYHWLDHGPSYTSEKWCWGPAVAIRLPIAHPASIAQRWNDDNPGEKPFDRINFGCEDGPSDWDGGDVLVADLDAIAAAWVDGSPILEQWPRGNAYQDIVAYRSKPSEQTVEVGDRVMIIQDGGWAGVRGLARAVNTARGVEIMPDAGSRHSHTGEPIAECYVADGAGFWGWSKVVRIDEQTAKDDGYVRIPVLSEREVDALWTMLRAEDQQHKPVLHTVRRLLAELNVLSAPETPVERFKRENPGLSADELLEKALAR